MFQFNLNFARENIIMITTDFNNLTMNSEKFNNQQMFSDLFPADFSGIKTICGHYFYPLAVNDELLLKLTVKNMKDNCSGNPWHCCSVKIR